MRLSGLDCRHDNTQGTSYQRLVSQNVRKDILRGLGLAIDAVTSFQGAQLRHPGNSPALPPFSRTLLPLLHAVVIIFSNLDDAAGSEF